MTYRKYRMVIHVIQEPVGKEIVFDSEVISQYNNLRVAPHGNLVFERKSFFNPYDTASSLVKEILGSESCTVHVRKEEGLLKTVCIYTALVFVDGIGNQKAVKGYSTDFLHYFKDCRFIT